MSASVRFALRAAPTAFLLVALTSCFGPSSTAPKTYTAKGKVVHGDGTPMTSGFIEFRSAKNASVRIHAMIQKDGSFTLETMADGERLRGAPEGEYTVTITPVLTGDQQSHADFKPIVLQKTYSIKAAEGNDLTITIEKPKR